MKIPIAFGMAAILVGVALAQRDPANPFPNHETPPSDWHCIPAKDAHDQLYNEHACSCLGMINEPMCPETEDEAKARQDSSRCKVYCHKEACSCMENCAPD